MKINELKIVSAKDLNESLAKTFGTKLRLQDFTNEQLEDARNRLRTQLSQVETNESFDTVHTSDAYQKGRMFLDVINQEIAERTKLAEKAKPDFLDLDKDGDKKEPMSKAADEKGDDKDDKKGLSAKQKKLPAGLQKAIAKKNEDVEVTEGAEEAATLTMAAKDMVDRVTGWMEDTAEMQAESMLELGDAVRDELGNAESEQYISSVKPTLEALYDQLEITRGVLSNGVAMLTGEQQSTMGTGEEEAPMEPMDAEADLEPTVDQEDDFAAAEPAAGGEEEAGREKRESVNRSRKLGLLLSGKKKT